VDTLRMRSEVVIALAWIKSGMDFIAPSVWHELPQEKVGGLYLASGALWVVACVVYLLIAMRPDMCKSGIVPALLFTAAAIPYIATFEEVTGGGWSQAFFVSVCSYTAGISWVIAAALWSIFELGLVKGRLAFECVVVALWALCGVSFVGTCTAESLAAPDRWVCVSSGSWWLGGVGSWIVALCCGVRLFQS